MLSPETHFLVPMCLVCKMVAPGKTCGLIFVIDVSSDSQDCTALPALEVVAMSLQFKWMSFMQVNKNTLDYEKHRPYTVSTQQSEETKASFNSQAKTFGILCQQNDVAFPKPVF